MYEGRLWHPVNLLKPTVNDNGNHQTPLKFYGVCCDWKSIKTGAGGFCLIGSRDLVLVACFFEVNLQGLLIAISPSFHHCFTI